MLIVEDHHRLVSRPPVAKESEWVKFSLSAYALAPLLEAVSVIFANECANTISAAVAIAFWM